MSEIINLQAAQQCSICLNDILPCDEASTDACRHRFCFKCIQRWSYAQASDGTHTCPLCRKAYRRYGAVHGDYNKEGRRAVWVNVPDRAAAPLLGLVEQLMDLERILTGALELITRMQPIGSLAVRAPANAAGAVAVHTDEGICRVRDGFETEPMGAHDPAKAA